MCKKRMSRLKRPGMEWDPFNAAAHMILVALRGNRQSSAYWKHEMSPDAESGGHIRLQIPSHSLLACRFDAGYELGGVRRLCGRGVCDRTTLG